jgi:predicted aspartyl protease
MSRAVRSPSQGDIVRRVKLCGLSKKGKLLRPWSDCPEVDALIDTGATITIISRTIAELAGAVIVSDLQILHGRSQDGALMAIKLASPGCRRSTHLVVVDDRSAATAGPRAFMILGHDYLRKNHAQIDYTDEGASVRCPPRKVKRHSQ